MLTDQPDRDLIRSALSDTIIVEAAAGTGKTTELVNRIVGVLSTGRARVQDVVAVTFTEKAAGELKLRLRAALEEARQQESLAAGRDLLEDAIERLEEAHVSTIHGFCADLLREHPVEAHVDPQFRVLTETQSERLFNESFRLWLQEQLSDPPEGIRRALRRHSGDEDGPVEQLRRAAWDLTNWRDFDSPWLREPFDREDLIAEIVRKTEAVALLTDDPVGAGDPLYQATRAIRRFRDDVQRTRESGMQDYDGWEAGLIEVRRDRAFRYGKRGSGKFYKPDVARQDVDDQRSKLAAALEYFEYVVNADLAARLHDELAASVERYERLKARAGALDFLDLLLLARNLVRDCEPVRRQFQARFSHIFVDEFQDTDPLQAEILLLLAASDPSEREWRRIIPLPGKLFIVGDPKQSIYRFRRADVGIYREVCELLARQGARQLALRTSFRAVPFIQSAVNRAFEPLMDGDRNTLQASYVPLAPFRPGRADQPSVVVLPVPEPYGVYGVAKWAIEESQPDAIAAFIDWLVNQSDWRVTERYIPRVPSDLSVAQHLSPQPSTAEGIEERRVHIAPRHVCLLFRRFTSWGKDVTRSYVNALEGRGIPQLLVGGKAFHNREEVETIRAALHAVEWPDDELSVFAALKGALFAIGDEDLLDYRTRAGHLHPFRIPGEMPERLASIVEALNLLKKLHADRNHRPVADTIAALLEATRAHVAFVLRPSGEQVLANVFHVAELARQFEVTGGISFRGFVEELDEAAERSQSPEAPILEEGSDGVRLMTVHKAKGLEFPVVILADITANLTPRRASRYLDPARGLCALQLARCLPFELHTHEAEELAREQAEGVRVAYVAATRARDLLVVPAVGDYGARVDDGWISPLNLAIYPSSSHRRSAEAAPGCPSFGTDSVLKRHDDRLGGDNVSPGLHRFSIPEGGGHDAGGPAQNAADSERRATGTRHAHEHYNVVWWDPFVLDLRKETGAGLRREELNDKDDDSRVVDEGLLGFRLWQSRRDEVVMSAKTPFLEVRTAGEWAASFTGSPDEGPFSSVELVELASPRGGPSGTRYGTLVHGVLSTVSLGATRAAIDEMTAVQARIIGATGEEAASATDVVEAVLAHPILGRARRADAAGRCRRETPVTYRDRGGALVEGVVDLAFEEGPGWTVVDFKTDQELADGLDEYRRQVGLYALAIGEAVKRPVSAVLMRV